MEQQFNPADKITVDVPLFIRLLEYAREDAKTDMDLHKVTENAVVLSETGKTLTMDDYDGIVKDSDGEDNPSIVNQLDKAKLQPTQDQMNEVKKINNMKQLNEIKRMQQLAGILVENEEVNEPIVWNWDKARSTSEDDEGVVYKVWGQGELYNYYGKFELFNSDNGDYRDIKDENDRKEGNFIYALKYTKDTDELIGELDPEDISL